MSLGPRECRFGYCKNEMALRHARADAERWEDVAIALRTENARLAAALARIAEHTEKRTMGGGVWCAWCEHGGRRNHHGECPSAIARAALIAAPMLSLGEPALVTPSGGSPVPTGETGGGEPLTVRHDVGAWHAAALVYGYNALIKALIEPTLEQKLYLRFMGDAALEEAAKLGFEVKVDASSNPVVLTVDCPPVHLNFRESDVEAMRTFLAARDASGPAPLNRKET